MVLKVFHDPESDYVSIDFKTGVEAKSYYQKGVIVRLDKTGQVLGIDITDSSNFFSGQDTLTLQEAIQLLKISDSTMRRKISEGQIKFKKPNGKDYVFKKADVLKLLK